MRISHLCSARVARRARRGGADAKPRRIVVLDFDGPRSLADIGRSTVMSLLGDQYDVVATRRWETARAQAAGHGPQQWRQASKQAGVDAVIEGWVQDEGRHHVMTVAVRDASTGNEIDTITVKLGDSGVSTEPGHQLAAQLEDIFGYIDEDVTSSSAARSSPTSARCDRCSARITRRRRRPTRGRLPTVPTRRRARRIIASTTASNLQKLEDDATMPRTTPTRRRSDGRRRTPEPKKEVAAATLDDDGKDTNDLVTLFGPDSKEAAIVSDGKIAHVPRPTPRFSISAGGYCSSRGITFDHDPERGEHTSTTRRARSHGMQVSAGCSRRRSQKQDGGLSGLGFSFDIEHSLGTTFTAMDDTGYGDYTCNHSQWETGIHYRYPIDIVTIDGGRLGNITHTIVDLPAVDRDPRHVVHVHVRRRASRISRSATARPGSARSTSTSSRPATSAQDWFGAGTAWACALDGDFTIPLPNNLYVKGDIEYRRVKSTSRAPARSSRPTGCGASTELRSPAAPSSASISDVNSRIHHQENHHVEPRRTHPFVRSTPTDLGTVSGGAARVASSGRATPTIN